MNSPLKLGPLEWDSMADLSLLRDLACIEDRSYGVVDGIASADCR